MAIDFRSILIIKLIKNFILVMNPENSEINLGVECVFIDFNEYLSRATDKVGIIISFEKEIVDGNDQIYMY